MPNEFIVVGENKHDQDELLVIGADGKYYEYDLQQNRVAPIEPDDHWELFPNAEEVSNEF